MLRVWWEWPFRLVSRTRWLELVKVEELYQQLMEGRSDCDKRIAALKAQTEKRLDAERGKCAARMRELYEKRLEMEHEAREAKEMLERFERLHAEICSQLTEEQSKRRHLVSVAREACRVLRMLSDLPEAEEAPQIEAVEEPTAVDVAIAEGNEIDLDALDAEAEDEARRAEG